MSKFKKQFAKYNRSVEKSPIQYSGVLGKSRSVVRHPLRKGYCYVRMADNLNELVVAFNDKVSPVYDLPVLLERRGNRWYITGRNVLRYTDWGTTSSYLPEHGNTHSFNRASPGADIVLVYPQQFMPALTYPNGVTGSSNVLFSEYPIRGSDGTWGYFGNTGTASLLQYKPDAGASLVILYVDTVSNGYHLETTTGSFVPADITSLYELLPYIPANTNSNYAPTSMVRLLTGTSSIEWDNIYDLRQFISASGGATGTITSIGIKDDGVSVGNATILNFIGNTIYAHVSGTTANISVSGSSIGGSDTNVLYNDGGVIGGDDNFLWDKNTRTLSVKGVGGNLGIVTSGDADGESYGLELLAGHATVPDTQGGAVYVQAGNALGTNSGGEIGIYGGDAELVLGNGDGGYLDLQAGDGAYGGGNGGTIYVAGGSSYSQSGLGGNVELSGGGNSIETGTAGSVLLRGGGADGATGIAGNVEIRGGSASGIDGTPGVVKVWDAKFQTPAVDFTDTKGNIEALTNLVGGENAYSSDFGAHGYYDTVLSRWVWSTEYLTAENLSANLTLYPTTAASDIGGYIKFVTDVSDPDYDAVAVDVPTGDITGADVLLSSGATEAGLIIGNPGVVTLTIVGNIKKLTGAASTDATFYFKLYHRDSLGTETLIGTSANTLLVSTFIYVEYSATLLFNDGDWSATDRIVLKFYGNKVGGGTAPTFAFQFGGETPVRCLFPLPTSVMLGNYLTIADAMTTYQPLDSDLTAIAGLVPSNDDVIQRKAGAWVNSSIANLKIDLGLTGTSSGDISEGGTGGVVGQVAEFVTDDKHIQAAKLIAPTGGILTLVSASPYTLTIPETMTASGRDVLDTHTRQIFIDGSADETVLKLQAHSTMGASSYLFRAENSSGAAKFTIGANTAGASHQVAIGQAPDNSYDFTIRNSTPNSTLPFAVQDYYGSSLFYVSPTGQFVIIGGMILSPTTSSSAHAPSTSGYVFQLYNYFEISVPEFRWSMFSDNVSSYSTGTGGLLRIKSIYRKSSGDGNFIGLKIDPTLEQSGTATGAMIGIDYVPTITSITGVHYAALFRSGYVGIGTATPTVPLEVAGVVKSQGRRQVVTTTAINLTQTVNHEVVVFTASGTYTLLAATGTGQTVRVCARTGVTVTIEASGAELIKGELNQTLYDNEDLIITDTAAGIWE